MGTVIVYATSHGCTEAAAQLLAQQLRDQTTLVNLKKHARPDLSGYDSVIVGGSIHAGQVQGKVKKFCKDHQETLGKKHLGLFLCCMEEGDTAWKQFEEAYPQDLKDHAAAKGLFGGAFDFEKMNFFQKAIVKKVAGVTESVSNIKEDNIREFAEIFNG